MIGSDPATRTRRSAAIEEEFVELVCSDEEWLRAEFEAIVESGWGSDDRPPPRPDSPPPPPGPPRGERWGEVRRHRCERERLLAVRVARQRGPPWWGCRLP